MRRPRLRSILLLTALAGAILTVAPAPAEHVHGGPDLFVTTSDGTSIAVTGTWTRPPLEPTSASRRLFTKAREHGQALGLELSEASSGGGSDANLVGALGVPVLDGLGIEGGGAHAIGEHVQLNSLPVRAGLLARLLVDPGL